MDSSIVWLEVFMIVHVLELYVSWYDEGEKPNSDVDPECVSDFELLSIFEVGPNLTFLGIAFEDQSPSTHEDVGTDHWGSKYNHLLAPLETQDAGNDCEKNAEENQCPGMIAGK